MKITALVTALPKPSPTGWGTAGKRITQELKLLCLNQDLNSGNLLERDFPLEFNVPVLQAIQGANLLPLYGHLHTRWHVGYSFAEDNLLMRRYGSNGKRYWDHIVVGSSWAQQEMIAAVGHDVPVTVAIQGVDCDIFKPSETIKPDPDLFTIFSGGKFELRKSQDVVIRACAVMMKRHKDVRLRASWFNPWAFSVDTMRESKLIKMPCTGHGTMADIIQTPIQNGIPADRIQFIETCSHEDMANWINGCDIGLFPNRCEAGTNLVLMETMACGLPVIATTTHGHADVTKQLIIRDHRYIANPLALSSFKFTVKRSGMPVAEWDEPDLDDTISALETAYLNRNSLKNYGYLNREAMLPFTWTACAQSILEACRS